MNKLKMFLLMMGFILSFLNVVAQKKLSEKIKQNFKNNWNKAFIDFTDNNAYLLGGMSLSKQNISERGYKSNFDYDLSDYNNNVFKPGYYAGFRIDGKFKKVHNYSFQMTLNKVSTGTNYNVSNSLPPFLGSFSKFKADDHFFTLDILMHYKKIIPFGDISKHKFYIVAGPSIGTRLSRQDENNLINNNYHLFLLRADVGIEFDNHSYYTLFVHYKQGITSFTKAPIVTHLNSFEIGMMIKASDLF